MLGKKKKIPPSPFLLQTPSPSPPPPPPSDACPQIITSSWRCFCLCRCSPPVLSCSGPLAGEVCLWGPGQQQSTGLHFIWLPHHHRAFLLRPLPPPLLPSPPPLPLPVRHPPPPTHPPPRPRTLLFIVFVRLRDDCLPETLAPVGMSPPARHVSCTALVASPPPPPPLPPASCWLVLLGVTLSPGQPASLWSVLSYPLTAFV